MTGNEELLRWNTRFAAEDYVFGTAPNAFLAAQSYRLRPGMKALAIADGEGRNGVWLARQGLDVQAVDFSEKGIAKALRLAASSGVTTYHAEQADLATWNWGETRFDAVVGIFFQFAGPELRAHIFDRIRHVLNPGGLVLIEGYRPEQIDYKTGGPSRVENLYTEAMLRDAFGDWDILHLAAYDTEMHEGAGHHGLSAVIDLVARKPAA